MIKKHSKRYAYLKQIIKPTALKLDDAINTLKTINKNSFDETFEVHIALSLDSRRSDHQIRSSFLLPHGFGIKNRVAVFTTPENIDGAYAAGAFFAGHTSLLSKISSGAFDFDVLITSSDLVSQLAKFGKILGPKGLMPSSKVGTISDNFIKAIGDFNKGRLEYRSDKSGVVHTKFGKLSLETEALCENFKCVLESVNFCKPAELRAKYIKSLNICTTMSPSIRVNYSYS